VHNCICKTNHYSLLHSYRLRSPIVLFSTIYFSIYGLSNAMAAEHLLKLWAKYFLASVLGNNKVFGCWLKHRSRPLVGGG